MAVPICSGELAASPAPEFYWAVVLGASPRVSLELSTTQKGPATINQEEQEAASFSHHFYQPGTEL